MRRVTGIFSPRVSSVPGRPLPSAREVSLELTALSDVDDDDLESRESSINSLLMMQVGQFLDHDVAHTPVHSRK